MPHRIVAGVHRLLAATRLLWRKRFGVLPLRRSMAPLNEWFSSPLGQVLLEQEQQLIDEHLRNLNERCLVMPQMIALAGDHQSMQRPRLV